MHTRGVYEGLCSTCEGVRREGVCTKCSVLQGVFVRECA